jgi:uncharacterized iron-regulated protein
MKSAAALLLLLLLAAAGCATTQSAGIVGERPVPPAPSAGEVHLDPLRFDGPDGFAFVDGRTGKALSFEELGARARTADFVLAAERHDQAAHHRLQELLLDAMAGGEGTLAVGLEMVPWHLQLPLDQFSRGEIDVDGLFAALDWERTWGHDAGLYRDMFTTGKEHEARFVALNAPRTLARAVAKKGVEGLSAEERSHLPDLDLGDETHRAELESYFLQHHPPGNAGAAFENFYAVQVLWDESMAERSVRARREGADRVLVLAGVGHVAGYRGIPQRILRRQPGATLMTVVPLDVDEGETAEDALRMAIARGDADVLAIKEPREVLHL